MAASQIMAGCYDTVIAGGAEQITMLAGKTNMDGFVNEKLAESHPGIYHPTNPPREGGKRAPGSSPVNPNPGQSIYSFT